MTNITSRYNRLITVISVCCCESIPRLDYLSSFSLEDSPQSCYGKFHVNNTNQTGPYRPTRLQSVEMLFYYKAFQKVKGNFHPSVHCMRHSGFILSLLHGQYCTGNAFMNCNYKAGIRFSRKEYSVVLHWVKISWIVEVVKQCVGHVIVRDRSDLPTIPAWTHLTQCQSAPRLKNVTRFPWKFFRAVWDRNARESPKNVSNVQIMLSRAVRK